MFDVLLGGAQEAALGVDELRAAHCHGAVSAARHDDLRRHVYDLRSSRHQGLILLLPLLVFPLTPRFYRRRMLASQPKWRRGEIATRRVAP